MVSQSEITPGLWENVMNRYGVGCRTEEDRSLAVKEIISRLQSCISGIEVGDDLKKQFMLPAMEYIFVNNKTIPHRPSEDEPQCLSALTECELTFHANRENTIRFRYFIQVTHGKLIHGVSWIKANTGVKYTDADFRPIYKFLSENFLQKNNAPDSPEEKYGIWDGKGHRIGVMHAYEVKRPIEGVTDKIVELMQQAVDFFKTNQEQINQ